MDKIDLLATVKNLTTGNFAIFLENSPSYVLMLEI